MGKSVRKMAYPMPTRAVYKDSTYTFLKYRCDIRKKLPDILLKFKIRCISMVFKMYVRFSCFNCCIW